jgi:hypothetical protein
MPESRGDALADPVAQSASHFSNSVGLDGLQRTYELVHLSLIRDVDLFTQATSAIELAWMVRQELFDSLSVLDIHNAFLSIADAVDQKFASGREMTPLPHYPSTALIASRLYRVFQPLLRARNTR